MHDLVAYTAIELVAHLGDPKFKGSLLLISLILFLFFGSMLLRIALFSILRGALVTGLLAKGLVSLRDGLLLRLLRIVLHDHEDEADFILHGDLVALLEENNFVTIHDLSKFTLPDLHNPISLSS